MAVSGTIGTLAVRIAADASAFRRGFDKANEKLSKFGDAAERVAKRSAIAFAGFSGAIAAVTRASSQQIQAERQLKTAFEATGQALDMQRFRDFASGLQSVTTTGDEVTIKMGAMMASMGMAQNQIESLIPGVLDLAAATGKSADTIARQLTRAIETGTGQLDRYGIMFSEAERATFRAGSEAQRTAMVMREMAKFQGQAAAEADTAAGAFTQLGNSFGDLLERIGAVLDAPLSGFFDMIRGFVEGIGPRLSGFAGGFLLVGAGVTALATALGTVVAIAPKVVAGFAVIKTAAASTQATVLGLVSVLIALIGATRIVIEAAQDPTELRKKFGFGKDGKQPGVGEFAGKFLAESFKRGLFIDKIASALDTGAEKGMGGITANVDKTLGRAAQSAAGKIDALGESASSFAETAGFDFKRLAVDLVSGLDNALEGVTGTVIDFNKNAADASQALVGFGNAAGEIEGKMLPHGPFMPSGGVSGPRPGSAPSSPTGAPTVEGPNFFGANAVDAAKAFDTNKETGEAIVDQANQTAGAIASAMGEAGGVISGVLQGATQGGVWGAIVNVIGQLVGKMKAFGEIGDMLMVSINESAQVFNGLLKGFKPFVEEVMITSSIVTDILGPVFNVFGDALKWFADLQRNITVFILKIVKAIGGVWNWIVDFVENTINKIPGVNVNLGRAKANVGAIQDAIDKLNGVAIEAAKVDAGKVDFEEGGAGSGDGTGGARGELLNAPSGFKVNLRKHQSAEGRALNPSSIAGSGPKVAVFNISAVDVQDMERQLHRVREFREFIEGAQRTTRTPFAVPRGGG